jgi:hypothetical protein
MSTVVEGGKWWAWPLAVLVPGLVNDVARMRSKATLRNDDIWMFEANRIRKLAHVAGFSQATTVPWGLLRPLMVQSGGLHLSSHKQELLPKEEVRLKHAIRIDAKLNHILPQRCFGSFGLMCIK